MSEIATSINVGRELVNAFGLPKRTRSFELRVVAGEAVTAQVEFFADRSYVLRTIKMIAREVRFVRAHDVNSKRDDRWIAMHKRNPDGTGAWQ